MLNVNAKPHVVKYVDGYYVFATRNLKGSDNIVFSMNCDPLQTCEEVREFIREKEPTRSTFIRDAIDRFFRNTRS